MPNGIGQFAEGFSKAFESSQERRRLRDALNLQERQFEVEQQHRDRTFGLDVLQFENQLSQQEQQFGLQQQQFGLDQERVELQRQAEANQERARANQEAIQNRQMDMQALGMLEQVEKVPKKLRKTYLTQLAPKMGIDPSSEEFKVVLDGLSGLDDEEIKVVTGQLKSIFPLLPPGQAAAFSLGVVSGQMTLPDAMTAITQLQQQAARQKPGGPQVPEIDRRLFGGRMEEAGAMQPLEEAAVDADPDVPEIETPQSLQQRAQQALLESQEAARRGDMEFATRMEAQARELRQMAEAMESSKEFDPAQVEKRAFAEETGKAAAAKRQPISPALSQLLGVQGAGKLTRGDAESVGIFTDMVGPKEIKELREAKTQSLQMIDRIDKLTSSVKGREELLGASGSIVRFLDTVRSQYKGVANLFKHVTGGRENAFTNSETIKNWSIDSGLASESAVVRSQIVGLAYDLAKANDSGRLSDQDFERSLQELGASQSVEQMVSVLETLKERTRTETMSEIESATGLKPFDMMTPDELVEFASEVEDERILKAIIVEQNKALSRRKRN